MRKIYSLIAMFIIALCANAKVLISYDHAAEAPEGITLGGTTAFKSVGIHSNADKVNCIQLANGYTTDGALNGNAVEVKVDGGFKAGDVVSLAGFFNNADDTKNSAFVIYVLDSSESGYSVLWTSEKLINGRLVADEPRVDTYTLEQDCEAFYIARSGNTGTNIYSLKVERGDAEGIPTYTFSASTTPAFGDYVIDQTYFPADEIAAKLGLADSVALGALINTNAAFYLQLPDGTRTNQGFSDNNQPWMTLASEIGTYGSDGAWFAGIAYDTDENGVPGVNAWIGDMPNYFKKIYTDSDLSATFYLVNGDKEVKFVFNLHVDAAVYTEMPALSDLTVVKTIELPITFNVGESYENNEVKYPVEGLSTLMTTLGITDDINNHIYVQTVKTDTVEGETVYSYGEKLSTLSDCGTDGWFGCYKNYDEATATETVFAVAPMAWAAGANTIYLHSIAVDADTISMSVGQYPGTYTAAGTYEPAELYLTVGTTSVLVKVIPTLVASEEPEPVDPDSYVEVGSCDVTVNDTPGAAGDYATESFTIDIAPAIEALGCEASSMTFCAYSSEGVISNATTTNEGGYYMDETGFIGKWGENATYYVNPTSLPDGKFAIGQNGRTAPYKDVTEPVTLNSTVLLVNGNKYYSIHLTYIVGPEEVDPDFKYTCVGNRLIKMQIIPSATDYAWATTASIDLEDVQEMIGTTNFKVYTDKYNSTTEALEWSDYDSMNNSTSTDGGAWFGTEVYTNSEGQNVVTNAGWGTNSFGIGIANGVVSFWQFPGQRQAGDTYLANVYLVNTETGDYLTYGIRVKYVDEVTPDLDYMTTTEKSEVNYTTLEGDVELDITPALEVLGIDADDAEAIEAVQVTCPDAPDTYNTLVGFDEDLSQTSKGYITTSDEDMVTTAQLHYSDGKLTASIDNIDGSLDSTEPVSVVVRLGLVYGNYVYLYEITLYNDAYAADAINAVAANASAKSIYTVAGAKVNALQKGINIVKVNGSVKKILK